jgi:hypothetical protein
MLKQVFVTTSVYALAHQLGMLQAIQEVTRQIEAPDRNSLPVVRTIARLRMLAEVGLGVDGGATYIGMARSRAFHSAFESGLAGWVTLDDDIEVTSSTCAAMLEALDDVVPRIVLVPYYIRAPQGVPSLADGVPELAARLAITLPAIFQERTIRFYHGQKLAIEGADFATARLVKLPPRQGGGFGMVGMNRRAMEEIVEHAKTFPDRESLRWLDGDGIEKLALFYERLEDGLWYGEDTSFFRYRVPESVSVEALLCGTIVHAGLPLNLDKLSELKTTV